MTTTRSMISMAAAAIMALLAGCGDITEEHIQKWQAAGNTGRLIREARTSHYQVIRLAAIHALGEMKAAGSEDALADLLKDEDLGVVLNAIDALARIATPAAQQHLLPVLQFPTPRGRTRAARALGDCQTERARDPLIALLDDEYDDAATAAATALGQLADPKAIEPLSEKVQSHAQPLRLACVTSLAQIGGNRTIPGLTRALGDLSEDVRKTTIDALVIIGKPALPPALKALHSKDDLTRQSGMALLEKLGEVPTGTKDYIWYLLARTVTKKKQVEIQPDTVRQLAGLGIEAIDSLVEAAAHPAPEIREHAIQAMEQIGEPCAAPALAAAQASAQPEVLRWLNGRNQWKGYPSWRLDLWGAAAALNPDLKLTPGTRADLAKTEHDARRLMDSPYFKPTREYVPWLIDQLTFVSPGNESTHETEQTRLAAKQLRRIRPLCLYPLLAAVGDTNLHVAGCAALTLQKLDGAPGKEVIIDAFARRLEAGEQLNTSRLYEALLQIDDPAAEALLCRVQPTMPRALQVFQRHYPDTRTSSLAERSAVRSATAPVTFRLGYFQNKRMKEMRVTFARNAAGEWTPTPPLPDQLP